jgi:hypothetical protein
MTINVIAPPLEAIKHGWVDPRVTSDESTQAEIHDSAQARRRRPRHRPRNRQCARDRRRRRRPDRWLLIGPDTAGNLLEVVVLITAEGTQIVIHAMPMRDKYAKLLEP